MGVFGLSWYFCCFVVNGNDVEGCLHLGFFVCPWLRPWLGWAAISKTPGRDARHYCQYKSMLPTHATAMGGV
jgi:hypothetical protein